MAKSRRAAKVRPGKWFIPLRGSYIPATWQGWLTYVPFIAYLAYSGIVGWRDTSSHDMAVLFIVPNWIAASGLMTWLAKWKS